MFYIFHGDDEHSQKKQLAALLAKQGDPAMLDLNTTRFSGAVSLGELRQACDPIPFLAPVRVVIVQNLFATNPDKPFLDALLAYLPQLPSTTRLIFLESKELLKNHRVLKLAEREKTGYVKLFNRPKGNEVERWIRQRVAEKNGRITPRAAHMLATNVGNDLRTLDNEIEKLVLYKGTGETAVIGADDVLLLSPYVAEANIFALVDALGNRNAKKASLLLQQKLDEGADPFYIFSMFVRQFRLLIQVKELAEAGLHPPAIAKELKLHGFVAGKLYQQSRGFSLPQLQQIYRHLLEMDVAAKTGQGDMLTALNLLVAGLTVAP